MRDDAKHVDSELIFDPANPNAGPALNWKAEPRDYVMAKALADMIAGIVNKAKGTALLDPSTVQADFICTHCNGRPQDFAAWLRLDPVDACAEYSLIYYQLDRRTGKLPDFVRLKCQKSA